MKNYRKFFTLIELLVVIAIITLLAAMLLPALSKAKDRAVTIQCAANMKQIGTALKQYQGDHNGFYPNGTTANGKDDNCWSYILYNNDYLRNSKVFLCPTDATERAAGYKFEGPRSYCGTSRFLDWGYNGAFRYVLEPYTGEYFKASAVRYPSKTITNLELMNNQYGDIHTSNGNLCHMSSSNFAGKLAVLNFTHFSNSAMNFLFLDSHVETIKKLALKYPDFDTEK